MYLYLCILVLAGVEFTFFTLAGMGLWFASVIKMLITQCYGIVFITAEQNLHSLKVFSVSHPTLPVRLHKKLRGKTSGATDPTDPRDIPDHMMSCSEYKFGKRRRKGSRGTFGGMAWVCTSHCYVWWIPDFLDMCEHWPADGN